MKEVLLHVYLRLKLAYEKYDDALRILTGIGLHLREGRTWIGDCFG